MRNGFVDKLIERLDRLDPQSIQAQFLRLSRERGLLETIFQSIQEGVIVIDGAGRLTYANRSAEQFLGFTLVSARGRPVSRFFGDVDWDLILRCDTDEWSRLVAQEIEINYPQHRILSFYVVPLGIEDDAEEDADTGAVVMLRDVTRDREQEATIVESERLNAVKLLAASVAHEIGNPLNALNIHLQILERELSEIGSGESDELAELVHVAKNEVSRLDIIITQFLRAIRPVPPNLARTRMDELLTETLTLLQQEIQDRNIEVELAFPEKVPPVMADRDQMKQAFFNIIRNAFQAMPDGGALAISISVSDRYLAIAFRDTGEGIRPEDFGRIFDAYQTTKADGSGLGLMIVQRIVQDHGGQIEVRSKPDEGTVFTMLLPLGEHRMRLLNARRSESNRGGEAPAATEDATHGDSN